MKANVVIAVEPSLPSMSRVADALEAQAFLPGRKAMQSALDAANDDQADALPLVLVLPCTHPALIVAAARDPRVDRLAVYVHAAVTLGPARTALLRAAFAFVDLTIVWDDDAERCAVMLGADPDRVARADGDLVSRLLTEPKRRNATEALASLALDVAALSGVVRLAEALTPDRGVNVVNYHRVLPVEEHRTYGRPQMALPAPIFEAQLAQLAQRGFTPVSEATAEGQRGRVAVTFDDGYEDNYRVAWPALERHSVPASIFVVTNLVGQDEPLWWDRIGHALFAWHRQGTPGALDDVVPTRARALATATSTEAAQTIIGDVLGELNDVDEQRRQLVLRAVESLTDERPGRTMLSWDEVRRMSESGIRFGSHTKNHVVLDQLGADEAADEVFGSQEDLEAHVSTGVDKSTALPRGVLGPLSEDELSQAGFRQVMTTEAGVNRTNDDSIFIKRRDGKMLTLRGRHHPAKLRLELTGLLDRLRRLADRGG